MAADGTPPDTVTGAGYSTRKQLVDAGSGGDPSRCERVTGRVILGRYAGDLPRKGRGFHLALCSEIVWLYAFDAKWRRNPLHGP